MLSMLLLFPVALQKAVLFFFPTNLK